VFNGIRALKLAAYPIPSDDSKKKGGVPMINQYESADVLELGRAQDIVLGNKMFCNCMDIVTGQYGTWAIDDLSDED